MLRQVSGGRRRVTYRLTSSGPAKRPRGLPVARTIPAMTPANPTADERTRQFNQLRNDVYDVYGLLGKVEQDVVIVRQDTSKLRHRVDSLDRRVDGLDRKVDGLDRKVAGLDRKVDGLDRKVAGLDQKVDGLDQKVDVLTARFDGLEGRFDGLETRFDGLETKFDGQGVRLERVEGAVIEILEILRHDRPTT